MTQALPTTCSTETGSKEALKQKASEAKVAVANLASEAKNYASARAIDAKDTAVGWARTGKEKATKVGESTVDYIQRNPYQALAIAAGIGFVAGLILKRR